ncbi:uncharacterized protein I303_106745 [Kwoniella dejecticola CBS 10117]|uniref:Membrane protein n=1 Tax=Kwoniella dejecticola CBS 10117 TaxID=1296121 RepID=A0A1A5ZTU4_9TREE|nr:uncharacterized protein I303_08613 [Kwoniella dejecticola CBS 10117]OBR81228.1 membrane protein [Kwoniella dejecticola CBS 10117]
MASKNEIAAEHGLHNHQTNSDGTLAPNNGTHTTGYTGGGGPMARFITPGGHPVDTSQPAFPVFHRKFANPAPLGLLAFAGTTLLLSFFNVSTRGVTVPNVILGMALGYGGLVQLIAGVEEWACGNTFGATAFASYGGFWLSFAVLYIPQFEVTAAYTDETMLASALGLYLACWGVITFLFLIACLRSSVALVGVFFFLDITFWLLAAGEFTGSATTHKAGGAFGIITAFVAMYTATAGLLTKESSYFLLPVGDLSRKD